MLIDNWFLRLTFFPADLQEERKLSENEIMYSPLIFYVEHGFFVRLESECSTEVLEYYRGYNERLCLVFGPNFCRNLKPKTMHIIYCSL